MTSSDKRNLIGGALLMLGVTIATFVWLMPTFETVKSAFIPETIEITVIITVVVALLSSGISLAFYDGGMDTPHTTKYYLIQPSMEEVIFRFNLFLVVHELEMGILSILVLCLVQAGFFAILHSGVLAKHFLLGLVWFVATLYGGIIPAMVGHTVANLTYRFKARAHHGWYDED